MVRWRRNECLKWRAAILVAALSAAFIVAVPGLARAQNLLDFLFGGFQQRQAPPPDANSPPPPPAARVAPPPFASENVRHAEGDTGHSMAYCVRLCDGQHFPLERLANATPIETCRAMCPASKTKVFFGSVIGSAVASDGARYADLDTAFVYRKQLVANCTCNGKAPFGLAPFDLSSDPTLRPGDIVSTTDGFKAFSGNRAGQTFTRVDSMTRPAEFNGASSRVQPSPQSEPPTEDEDPGTIAPGVDLGRQPNR